MSGFNESIAVPKNGLGWHRVLAPTAGVRVSPLCLGAMNFGDAWKGFMGECDKKSTFEILDYFFENGGNFIDTANNYQDEESEKWIGEWAKERGVRDQLVIATKYTTFYPQNGEKIFANYQGQHAKSLRHSVDASLKKLQTEYIDLLYVHWWDHTTSIPEVMQSLNHMVQAGKVLYLGISDCPAWVVSKANQYARDHGLAQFVIYQGRWSAADRDIERDVIPMCRDEGMALAPWGALGGGSFKTDEQRNSEEGRKFPVSDRQIQVSKVLEKIANRKKTAITSVALAYVMQKTPNVFPIIGTRKLEHLKGNIAALSLELTKEDIDEIEDAAPFDPGFPNNFMFEFHTSQKYKASLTGADIPLLQRKSNLDTVQYQTAIKPRKFDS